MSAEIVIAIISAGSALAGVLISQWYEIRSKRKDLYYRLWEKVLGRRVEAHEQIIHLSKTLRTMVSLGYEERDGQLARTPAIMRSRENFEEWYSYFGQVVAPNSTWLSIEVTREVYFLQDYVVNLYEFLRQVNSRDFPKVGAILRDDFVQLSVNIEKLAFDFFSQDLRELHLGDLDKWHKHPIEKTERRLAEMALLSRQNELQVFITGFNSE
jgi:hypothetical protein